MQQRFTFHKTEHLKSRKLISSLFSSKQSVGAYPVRFFWKEIPLREEGVCMQVSFSVSKKKFKRAVDRNRLKRLMREAYRLQKAALLEQLTANGKSVVGMWIFVGNELVEYPEIEKAVRKALERFPQI